MGKTHQDPVTRALERGEARLGACPAVQLGPLLGAGGGVTGAFVTLHVLLVDEVHGTVAERLRCATHGCHVAQVVQPLHHRHHTGRPPAPCASAACEREEERRGEEQRTIFGSGLALPLLGLGMPPPRKQTQGGSKIGSSSVCRVGWVSSSSRGMWGGDALLLSTGATGNRNPNPAPS